MMQSTPARRQIRGQFADAASMPYPDIQAELVALPAGERLRTKEPTLPKLLKLFAMREIGEAGLYHQTYAAQHPGTI
ncbi:MAG: hypothetical protein ACN6O3_20835 [Comamonas sp.]